MQVGGNYNSNYNSYPGVNYKYSNHTHHITECLHEEQAPAKRMGGAADSTGVTLELQGNSAEKAQEAVIEAGEAVSKGYWKKGLGFVLGFGDALGQEGNRTGDSISMFEGDNPGLGKGLLRSVSVIIPMIKQGFHVLVAEPIETVREKLKVGIHTALKRFGKDSEPFGALTDPGTGSLFGNRTGSGAGRGRSRSGNSQGKEEDIKTAPVVNEHLMDSYSNSGKYCKINENLTYSQGRAPYKVSGQNRQRKAEDSY